MAKTTPKSFHFRAKTTWGGARRGMLSAAGKPDVVVGSPPEFRGDPDIWAPEEMLVAALNTCMMLTFLTLAQHRSVGLAGYESEADGLLENVDGKFRITQITVRPRVTLASEADRLPAEEAMERVEAQCFIANSITAKVTLEPEFTIAAAAR